MAITPHYDCTLNEHSSYEDWNLPVSFVKKRHTEPIEGTKVVAQSWRMKERMKTVSVALVVCLNVGVDPPDIVKTQPCARLECWIDPLSMSPQKALEMVGQNLQKQYERWQPRARYKQSLDPTVDEIKKLCTSLRRNAKEERVLFHYNGHGVPKPTSNGEIWVFNRTYTQYIPLSIYDLQTWMGAPSIYVYDCSNAGVIVDLFKQFADQHEKEFEQSSGQNSHSGSTPSFKNCIQLAACSADQILPMNPDLPADIFTSCLTTPIKIALRWFVMQDSSKLVPNISLDLIDKIPGQLNDRRTMLGELNWIFTAITDTIAWNVLPRDLFQKLFRQDLLVASLFRNYLLAERIMRSYDCTPVSCPKLPSTFQHPMWQAWDLSLDLCLSQLPAVLECEDNYKHSPFFEEQLTAFQVWLDMGSDQRNPPEQLPIVLQVLLSQVHRLRALELLSRFLDLGAWAVNLALSVGIFPYMLKLLQSSARELRYLLVFIWAKILAVDSSCQVDLVRDNGYRYFLQILQDYSVASDHRTIAAFAMAVIVQDYPPGQELALQENLVSICLEQINDANIQLKLWTIICLAKLWERYDKARWCGVRDSAHEKLFVLLKDKEPEVRAAAVYALGTFMNTDELERTKHATNIDQSVAMMLINVVSQDMSTLVRKELVNALQWVILAFENSFLSVATQEMKATLPISPQEQIIPIPSVMSALKRNLSRERIKITFTGYGIENINQVDGTNNQLDRDTYPERLKRVSSSSSISSGSNSSLPTISYGSFYTKIWQGLASLETDPFLKVAKMAHASMDYIRDQVFEWPRHKEDVIDGPSSLGALYNVRDSVMGKEWIDPSKNQSFFSLPPSPSNRSYLSVDSPPKNLSSTGSSMDLNRLGARVRYSLQCRRTMPNMISENASDDEQKRLVSTKFVDWCGKYFSECKKPHSDRCDIESRAHFEREWRYARNHVQEKVSRDECSRSYQFRVENVIFSTRCAQAPAVLLFHPYENHFITTAKDAFIVWDYNTNSKLTHWNPDRGIWNRNISRITALDLVNAHDNTMLLVGSEDGAVRLWSNYTNNLPNREPVLVTAWQALSELSSSNRTASGLRMAWDQRSQTLLAGGDARVVRVWDAESELKLTDVSIGTEAWVNSLSVDSDGGGNIFAAGCSDGSVRIFDRRLAANNCRTITYREHTGVIINAKIRRCSDLLVAGCMNGDVKTYDIRTKSSILTCRTDTRTTAFDVHKSADLFACGGINQLTAYELSGGNVLNSVKNYDWFMTPKIASTVSYISFHPNRVMLGYSSIDCSIVISSLDSKKWPSNSA
ncbi:regulatory-associated protein of mTOR isoform X2 [Planococcus citri]|uniref:regulatory-associated protein of mTOR isoform X2 n=1 Tax=Planococcus citri TaxID=170843 RepID=UPI0031F7D272